MKNSDVLPKTNILFSTADRTVSLHSAQISFWNSHFVLSETAGFLKCKLESSHRLPLPGSSTLMKVLCSCQANMGRADIRGLCLGLYKNYIKLISLVIGWEDRFRAYVFTSSTKKLGISKGPGKSSKSKDTRKIHMLSCLRELLRHSRNVSSSRVSFSTDISQDIHFRGVSCTKISRAKLESLFAWWRHLHLPVRSDRVLFLLLVCF